MTKREERINYLKKCKKQANCFLTFYKEKNSTAGNKSWGRAKIDLNIKNLKKYVLFANKLLKDRKKLNDYVDAANKLEESDIHSDFNKIFCSVYMEGYDLYFKILQCSPYYSFDYNLEWIKDGTVQEHIQIALGKESVEILSEKYYSYRLSKVDNLIESYIQSNNSYLNCHEIFFNALALSKSENYLASSLLILPGIESLIRTLIKKSLKYHDSRLSDEELENKIEKYSSLEKLINECALQNDYPISIVEAFLLADFVPDSNLESYQNKYAEHIKEAAKIEQLEEKIKVFVSEITNQQITKNEIPERAKELEVHIDKADVDKDKLIENLSANDYSISIKVKLYFLTGRIKDLRNELIHGKFDKFSTKYYNYILIAALHEVIVLLQEYDDIYRTSR